MMSVRTYGIDRLKACEGQEIGTSDWMLVDQARIDAFADTTEDHQYIHVDLARARETPFGGTIAHGFLLLSLLSAMSCSGMPAIDGSVMGINYGFDKIRFLTPVRAGGRVRGRFALKSLEDKGGGRWMLRLEVTIEVEDEVRPAAIAEWITMTMM